MLYDFYYNLFRNELYDFFASYLMLISQLGMLYIRACRKYIKTLIISELDLFLFR